MFSTIARTNRVTSSTFCRASYRTTPQIRSKGITEATKAWADTIADIRAASTYKNERVITTPQNASIKVKGSDQPVLNFCANNYLGLSDNPKLVEKAIESLKQYGLGLSSVRFICGTQTIHKDLEKKIAEFHKKEDTILYGSCFDANGGIFEGILNPEKDAVFSDALNHASIIDGMRLYKGKKFVYNHLDMADLEEKLAQSEHRIKLIVTDGVFSMDGDIAPLDKICEIADKHNAIIMIDECHATGFVGKTGRGTPEYFGVEDRIDIINSTLGKALGGSTGGYTTGKKEMIEVLRNKSRPYLFSNSIAPPIIGAGIAVYDMLMESTNLRDKLELNTKLFREGMGAAGFKLGGNPVHPIAPVMLGEASLASKFAEKLLAEGIYVIGFSFPVVTQGKARIRVQLSAAHSPEDIQKAVRAFTKIGKELNVI